MRRGPKRLGLWNWQLFTKASNYKFDIWCAIFPDFDNLTQNFYKISNHFLRLLTWCNRNVSCWLNHCLKAISLWHRVNHYYRCALLWIPFLNTQLSSITLTSDNHRYLFVPKCLAWKTSCLKSNIAAESIFLIQICKFSFEYNFSDPISPPSA